MLDHISCSLKALVKGPLSKPLRRVGAVAIASAAFALVGACATLTKTATSGIPAVLDVPATDVLLLRAHGIGVQIYQCQASREDPNRYEWVFQAPEAQLFDHTGKPIIRHFAGPTWEVTDGSSVVGEVTAKDSGPDPMAIAWLRLHATSTAGRGLLSHTQDIQRLNTVGGKAPAGGCNAALTGSEARTRYSADYLFYRARS